MHLGKSPRHASTRHLSLVSPNRFLRDCVPWWLICSTYPQWNTTPFVLSFVRDLKHKCSCAFTACPLLLRIVSFQEMLSLLGTLSSHKLDRVHWGGKQTKTSTYNSQSVFNCTSVMPICQCQEYSYSIALYRRKTEITVHSNPQEDGLYTYVKLSSDYLKTSLCCWVLNIHILIYKRGKFCQQFVNEKRNKKKMHWMFGIRYQHLTLDFVNIDSIEMQSIL